MNPADADALDRRIKISRAVLLAGAELLPCWPKIEFRGTERNKPVPVAGLEGRKHRWEVISGVWRCRVCLRGSMAETPPPEGGCSGRSRLDADALSRLNHKVIALPCADNSLLFTLA